MVRWWRRSIYRSNAARVCVRLRRNGGKGSGRRLYSEKGKSETWLAGGSKLPLVNVSTAIAFNLSMLGQREPSPFQHLSALLSQIVLWAGYGEARGRQTECTAAVQQLFGVSTKVDNLVPMAGDKVMSFIVNSRQVPLQLLGPGGIRCLSCLICLSVIEQHSFGWHHQPQAHSLWLASRVAAFPRPIFSHPLIKSDDDNK